MAKKRRLFLIRRDGNQYKSFGIIRDQDPVTGETSFCLTWPGRGPVRNHRAEG